MPSNLCNMVVCNFLAASNPILFERVFWWKFLWWVCVLSSSLVLYHANASSQRSLPWTLRSSIWNLDGMHKNPRQHPIHTHHGMYITGLSGIIDNTLVAVEQVSLLQRNSWLLHLCAWPLLKFSFARSTAMKSQKMRDRCTQSTRWSRLVSSTSFQVDRQVGTYAIGTKVFLDLHAFCTGKFTFSTDRVIMWIFLLKIVRVIGSV